MVIEIPDAKAGFDGFVTDRGGSLWHAAWLLTGDRHHAEDLVQTALAKTWPRYASFESNRHFESYVRTTIYRTFVSWWRRRQWRSEIPTELPEKPGPDSGHIELRADLMAAISQLPRPQRAVLVLRYFEDLPLAEVAKTLGMPEGTVASHAHRGLRALRSSSQLIDLKEES